MRKTENNFDIRPNNFLTAQKPQKKISVPTKVKGKVLKQRYKHIYVLVYKFLKQLQRKQTEIMNATAVQGDKNHEPKIQKSKNNNNTSIKQSNLSKNKNKTKSKRQQKIT